jgi:hypothetical protein
VGRTRYWSRTRLGHMAVALLVVAAFVGPSAHAAPRPERLDLPNGWQPEGISASGEFFYAGSLADGDVSAATRVPTRGGCWSTRLPAGSRSA